MATRGLVVLVDGDVEIENGKKTPNNFVRNLRVQDGQILFINGDLTMHEGSTIYGNVVNGDLENKRSRKF